MKTINPATGKLVQEYQEHSDIAKRIGLAQSSFKEWSGKTFSDRAACMKKLAGLLRQKGEECARLMTVEMGKPVRQARTEVLKCALCCDYFADGAEKFLKEETVDASSFIAFEPLGVILGVMPWNFPFWQVFRFIAPTLMAGNGVLIKHASNVSGCALAIEALVEEAGFPKHLLKVLLISPDRLKEVIEDERVKAITLTGSEKAGMSIASLGGKALKKTVLELGGSDPFIVLEDADMKACAETAINARMMNNGQSCIAAKRFIVVESRLEEFCSRVIAGLKDYKIGDPLLEETEAGPLARSDLRETLEQQLKRSLDLGADLLYGGRRLEGEGYFYQPAVIARVKRGMSVYEEETFGPLFAVITVKDAEEAIHTANDSRFGLGASVWTQDLEKGKKIAKKIEAGMVFINAQTSSKVELPFGGIKQSGYGRELSHYGIKEFVNIKSIFIS